MLSASNVFASVFGDLVLQPLHSETPLAPSYLDELYDQSVQPQWQRVGDGKKTIIEIPLPLTKWVQRREDWVKTTKECLDLLHETIMYYRDTTLLLANRGIPEHAQIQGTKELLALISSQVPVDYFVYALTQVIVWVGSTQMNIVRTGEYEDLPGDKETALQTLQVLLEGLQLMGLGRDRTAIAYAKATDALLHLYVRRYRPTTVVMNSSGYFGMTNVEHLLETDFVPKLKKLMELASTLNGDLVPGTDGVVNQVDAIRIKQLGCDKFAHLMARKLYRNITGGFIEQDEELRMDYRVSLLIIIQYNMPDPY